MIKNNLDRVLGFSGIIGIVVLWATILIGMSISGLKLIDSRPFSSLGVDPQTASLFSTGLIISAALFSIFGFFLQRKFAVKSKFLMYLLIGQAGQVVAALAPYGSDSRYKTLHTLAAFTLALSLPILIRSFAYSQINSKYFKLYIRLFRLELAAFLIGMGIFIFTTGIAPLGQAMPAIGFHIWIIALTLITHRTLQDN
ncbi:MAG: hypothetical protein M3Q36_03930 [bacterium]|nr:hypothetical protein [bacterium]